MPTLRTRLPDTQPRTDSAHRGNAISRDLSGEHLRGLHLQRISIRYAIAYSRYAGHVRSHVCAADEYHQEFIRPDQRHR